MLTIIKKFKSSVYLILISSVAGVLVGCGGTGVITPNAPQFSKCYNEETKTAKNCEDIDYKKLLESKKEWKIISYHFKGKTIALKQSAESHFVLQFKDNQINGSLGCNRFFGDYWIEGNMLKLGNAGMTRKMCEPEVMTHEDIMVQNFLNVSTKIVVVEETKGMSKIFFIGKDFYLVLN